MQNDKDEAPFQQVRMKSRKKTSQKYEKTGKIIQREEEQTGNAFQTLADVNTYETENIIEKPVDS